jgi:hypothetical protein
VCSEQRSLSGACPATIGSVGNAQHADRKLGSAGASWRLGIRAISLGMLGSYNQDYGSNKKAPCGLQKSLKIHVQVSSAISAVRAERQSAK